MTRCTTADCGQLAVRLVQVMDAFPNEGPWPYCEECAASLITDAGDVDRGPVSLITDEMVERAASALAIEEDYDPNQYPSGTWAAIRNGYRVKARAVLVAALENKQPEEGS